MSDPSLICPSCVEPYDTGDVSEYPNKRWSRLPVFSVVCHHNCCCSCLAELQDVSIANDGYENRSCWFSCPTCHVDMAFDAEDLPVDEYKCEEMRRCISQAAAPATEMSSEGPDAKKATIPVASMTRDVIDLSSRSSGISEKEAAESASASTVPPAVTPLFNKNKPQKSARSLLNSAPRPGRNRSPGANFAVTPSPIMGNKLSDGASRSTGSAQKKGETHLSFDWDAASESKSGSGSDSDREKEPLSTALKSGHETANIANGSDSASANMKDDLGDTDLKDSCRKGGKQSVTSNLVPTTHSPEDIDIDHKEVECGSTKTPHMTDPSPAVSKSAVLERSDVALAGNPAKTDQKEESSKVNKGHPTSGIDISSIDDDKCGKESQQGGGDANEETTKEYSEGEPRTVSKDIVDPHEENPGHMTSTSGSPLDQEHKSNPIRGTAGSPPILIAQGGAEHTCPEEQQNVEQDEGRVVAENDGDSIPFNDSAELSCCGKSAENERVASQKDQDLSDIMRVAEDQRAHAEELRAADTKRLRMDRARESKSLLGIVPDKDKDPLQAIATAAMEPHLENFIGGLHKESGSSRLQKSDLERTECSTPNPAEASQKFPQSNLVNDDSSIKRTEASEIALHPTNIRKVAFPRDGHIFDILVPRSDTGSFGIKLNVGKDKIFTIIKENVEGHLSLAVNDIILGVNGKSMLVEDNLPKSFPEVVAAIQNQPKNDPTIKLRILRSRGNESESSNCLTVFKSPDFIVSDILVHRKEKPPKVGKFCLDVAHDAGSGLTYVTRNFGDNIYPLVGDFILSVAGKSMVKKRNLSSSKAVLKAVRSLPTTEEAVQLRILRLLSNKYATDKQSLVELARHFGDQKRSSPTNETRVQSVPNKNDSSGEKSKSKRNPCPRSGNCRKSKLSTNSLGLSGWMFDVRVPYFRESAPPYSYGLKLKRDDSKTELTTIVTNIARHPVLLAGDIIVGVNGKAILTEGKRPESYGAVIKAFRERSSSKAAVELKLLRRYNNDALDNITSPISTNDSSRTESKETARDGTMKKCESTPEKSNKDISTLDVIDSPIRREDSWKLVWAKLRSWGWTDGCSGILNHCYFKPGKHGQEGIAEGVDFFVSERALKEYIHITFDWTGKKGDLDECEEHVTTLLHGRKQTVGGRSRSNSLSAEDQQNPHESHQDVIEAPEDKVQVIETSEDEIQVTEEAEAELECDASIQQQATDAEKSHYNNEGTATTENIKDAIEFTANEVQVKSLSFGSVSVREYKRALSLESVPTDGGWPLGLSNEVVREYSAGDVNDFEQRRQVELRGRLAKVLNDQRTQLKHNRCRDDNDDTSPESSSPAKLQRLHLEPLLKGGNLETRPYDYKSCDKVVAHRRLLADAAEGEDGDRQEELLEIFKDGKNPLFASRPEDERMGIFIRDADLSNDDMYSAGSDVVMEDMNGSSTLCSPTRRKLRSNLLDGYKPNKYYSQTEILNVRNELAQLRTRRSGVGENGCSCRKLVVLLPGRSAKGKNRRLQRLSERTVKEELQKRGLMHGSNMQKSREELEKLLHDTVQKEPCCANNDCPCAKNNIECNADACSCWHANHDSTNDQIAILNPNVIRERCCNPNGIYVVDFDAINAHRRQILTRGPPPTATESENGIHLCSPIEDRDSDVLSLEDKHTVCPGNTPTIDVVEAESSNSSNRKEGAVTADSRSSRESNQESQVSEYAHDTSAHNITQAASSLEPKESMPNGEQASRAVVAGAGSSCDSSREPRVSERERDTSGQPSAASNPVIEEAPTDQSHNKNHPVATAASPNSSHPNICTVIRSWIDSVPMDQSCVAFKSSQGPGLTFEASVNRRDSCDSSSSLPFGLRLEFDRDGLMSIAENNSGNASLLVGDNIIAVNGLALADDLPSGPRPKPQGFVIESLVEQTRNKSTAATIVKLRIFRRLKNQIQPINRSPAADPMSPTNICMVNCAGWGFDILIKRKDNKAFGLSLARGSSGFTQIMANKRSNSHILIGDIVVGVNGESMMRDGPLSHETVLSTFKHVPESQSTVRLRLFRRCEDGKCSELDFGIQATVQDTDVMSSCRPAQPSHERLGHGQHVPTKMHSQQRQPLPPFHRFHPLPPPYPGIPPPYPGIPPPYPGMPPHYRMPRLRPPPPSSGPAYYDYPTAPPGPQHMYLMPPALHSGRSRGRNKKRGCYIMSQGLTDEQVERRDKERKAEYDRRCRRVKADEGGKCSELDFGIQATVQDDNAGTIRNKTSAAAEEDVAEAMLVSETSSIGKNTRKRSRGAAAAREAADSSAENVNLVPDSTNNCAANSRLQKSRRTTIELLDSDSDAEDEQDDSMEATTLPDASRRNNEDEQHDLSLQPQILADALSIIQRGGSRNQSSSEVVDLCDSD